MIKRAKTGSVLAELPAVLWVILCLFLFPLIDLASIGMRIASVQYVAQRACVLAARAKSFEAPLPGYPSATNVASAEAAQLGGTFNGVQVKHVDTQILVTDINTKNVTPYNHALSKPADTSDYTYQIDVSVTAQIQPLVTLPFLPIPISGITGPLVITASDRQFAECPNGLNI